MTDAFVSRPTRDVQSSNGYNFSTFQLRLIFSFALWSVRTGHHGSGIARVGLGMLLVRDARLLRKKIFIIKLRHETNLAPLLTRPRLFVIPSSSSSRTINHRTKKKLAPHPARDTIQFRTSSRFFPKLSCPCHAPVRQWMSSSTYGGGNHLVRAVRRRSTSHHVARWTGAGNSASSADSPTCPRLREMYF